MIAGITRALAATIYPARCQACRAHFHPPDISRKWMSPGMRLMGRSDMKSLFREEMAPFLCDQCRGRFTPMEKPCCTACGKMFSAVNGQDHICGDCIASPGPYETVRSAGLLEGALMDAIHALKYNGRIQLARPLGRILLAMLIYEFTIDHIDIIVPVPLHRARLRMRGFNQAALMLREWPDFQPFRRAEIIIEPHLLVRTVNTVSQTGLGRGKREENVRGAFSVARPDMVKSKRLVLIDDVFTTGATSAECARVLMGAGAAAVSILTLAHAG